MRIQILTRRIVLLAATLLVTAMWQISRADTPDLTEFLAGSNGQIACPNQAFGVYADVDGNGTFDTMVVFFTVAGEAFPQGPDPNFGYGNWLYFFSGVNDNGCGTATPARFVIRFVDKLAAHRSAVRQ